MIGGVALGVSLSVPLLVTLCLMAGVVGGLIVRLLTAAWQTRRAHRRAVLGAPDQEHLRVAWEDVRKQRTRMRAVMDRFDETLRGVDPTEARLRRLRDEAESFRKKADA